MRLNSFDFKDIFTQKLTQIKLISTKKQHFSSVRQMGGRSFTSSNKHIQNKCDKFKCLKRKRLIIQQQVGNIAKQLFQTVHAIESKPKARPAFFHHFLHHPFSKHAIILSSVVLYFTILSVFNFNLFTQSIHHP